MERANRKQNKKKTGIHFQRAWPRITLRPMQRNDALPDLKLSRVRSNGSNNTGELVAEYSWLLDERESAFAVEHVAIGNSARSDFH